MSLHLPWRLAAFIVLSGSTAAQAAALATCHVTYGGETVDHAVAAVDDPHAVPTVAVGSYFLIRFVLQTRPVALAAFKAYVYADRSDAPVLIHQLDVAWPPTPSPRGRPGGYTGLHRVYEPVRDGELQYWCERRPAQEAR
ncbi:hypothetical protein [Sphaerotilus mobilis]|uniref:Uncharacterized protein n=1 Tax=Sphaerotilus mobilis TaxID=47994 RepID=A0A4Q7LU12_9BURK|nr:hypothetical protein [Sphaerotilus mobilis]RZS57971.1 hypothetical protein EV685_0247 [Sphaerotilus mobilis]